VRSVHLHKSGINSTGENLAGKFGIETLREDNTLRFGGDSLIERASCNFFFLLSLIPRMQFLCGAGYCHSADQCHDDTRQRRQIRARFTYRIDNANPDQQQRPNGYKRFGLPIQAVIAIKKRSALILTNLRKGNEICPNKPHHSRA